MLAALVCAAALAGCTGEAPAGPAAPGTHELRGVVVDEAIRPLAGVAVVAVGRGWNATTDGSGLWAIAGVPPGELTLDFDLSGFRPVRLPVIVAQQTPLVRVVLPAVPTGAGYQDTLVFDAYVDASFGAASVITADATGQEVGCTCRFPFRSEGAADAIVLEAIWDDRIDPPPVHTTEYNWIVAAADKQARGAGPNPLLHELKALEFGDQEFSFDQVRAYNITVLPDAVWPSAAQSYRVFVSLFYGKPVPEGWSYVGTAGQA